MLTLGLLVHIDSNEGNRMEDYMAVRCMDNSGSKLLLCTCNALGIVSLFQWPCAPGPGPGNRGRCLRWVPYHLSS
jgi:hypothetical protein